MKSFGRLVAEKLAVFVMAAAVVVIVFDSLYRAVFDMSLFAMLRMIPWDYVPVIVLGVVLLALMKAFESDLQQ